MSGSVLLDTNIVIGLFASDQAVLSRLSKTDSIFIPSVVLGELYFGAYKSAHPDQNVRRVEELVATSAILTCDAATAAHYGRIKKALRDKGRPLPELIKITLSFLLNFIFHKAPITTALDGSQSTIFLKIVYAFLISRSVNNMTL